MNQLIDNRGLEVTVASQAALDKFEIALAQMLSYTGDPVESVDEAIAEDPDFVLAHCLRAHAGGVMADSAFRDHIRESLAAVSTLEEKANERERKHIIAARYWLDGRFNRATDMLESVLVDYPRDTLALLIAHLFDFYRGDSQNLRDRVARVLPHYPKDSAEIGYAFGMYSFGLEECNEYVIAEETGKQAVEMNPGDVWAIHAVAHVLEMQGRQVDGIKWYESRLNDWSVDNGFSVHNWWHLALYYLDLEQYDKVLEIYDKSIADGTVALEMLDASALLWRLYLKKIDTGDRWQALNDKWEKTIDQAGYYCFNDAHAMMAFAASGQFGLADSLIMRLENQASEDNDSGSMVRRVGLPVSQALYSFAKGDYPNSVDLMSKVRYTANHFGGSHAQRDFISQTLIESAIRSNQLNYARALLAERAAKKPDSPPTWKQTWRVMRKLECEDDAGSAMDRAERMISQSCAELSRS